MKLTVASIDTKRKGLTSNTFPFDASKTNIHLPTSFSSSVVTLTNKSSISQRILILPFLTPHFKCTRLDNNNQNGMIAPGMSLKLKIELNAILPGQKCSDSLRLRASSIEKNKSLPTGTLNQASITQSKTKREYVEMEIELIGGDLSSSPFLSVKNENSTDEEMNTPEIYTESIKQNKFTSSRLFSTTKKNNELHDLEKITKLSNISSHMLNVDPNDSLRSQLNPQSYSAIDFKNLPSVFNFNASIVGSTSVQRFIVKNIGERGATFHWTENSNDKKGKWIGNHLFSFISFERDDITARSEISDDSQDLSGTSYFEGGSFYLKANETGIATISFTPSRVDTFVHTIYLVNDESSDIVEFSLVGEGVWPEIIRENINTQNNLQNNLPIPNTIFFPKVFSTESQEKQVKYTNLSNIPIDFHWKLFKLYKNSTGKETLSCQKLDELIDNSIFQITPNIGSIPPNEEQIFTIQFTGPSNLTSLTVYDAYLALYIDNIPGPNSEAIEDLEDYPFYQHVEADDITYFYNKLTSLKSSTDPHDSFKSSNALFNELLETKSQVAKDYDTLCSVCISFFKVHSVCEPPLIRFSNHHILYGLPLTIGSLSERKFQIINDSPIPTNFSFGGDIESEYFISSFTPNQGELPANSRVTIKFSFLPKMLGEIATAFQCYFSDQLREPLIFRIRAIVKGPTLYIDSTMIDFGVSEVGKKMSTTIRLTNASDANLNFMFGSYNSLHASLNNSENSIHNHSQYEEGLEEYAQSLEPKPKQINENYQPMITFEPHTYQLQPFESILVNVHLFGQYPISLNEIVPIYVEFGDTSFVSLRADVQHPKVILGENNIVDFGTTYLETPSEYKIVTLKNASSLETNFFFHSEELNQDPDFQVSVVPEYATIPPNGLFNVRIQTVSRTLGDFEKILPCFFQDSQNLYSGLVLKSHVEGLAIQLAVKNHNIQSSWKVISYNNDQIDDLAIDFGKVTIGEKPKTVQLKLKKIVPMFSFFRIHFENYQAPVVHSRRQAIVSFHGESASTRSSRGQAMNGRETSRSSAIRSKVQKDKSLLTKQALPFQSKDALDHHEQQKKRESDEKFFEEALSNEFGCAFDASLLNGPIDGETIVELTCYSNIAGEYHDFMILDIEPLNPIRIPVRATVVGCPVQILQKTLGLRPMHDINDQLNPLLVWPNLQPTTSESNEGITRVLHIKNVFGTPISLSWRYVPGGAPIRTSIKVNEDSKIQIECEENEVDTNQILDLASGIPYSISPMNRVIKPGEIVPFNIIYTPKIVPQEWKSCFLKSHCTFVTKRKFPTNTKSYDSVDLDSKYILPIRIQMKGDVIESKVDVHCNTIKYKCSIYDVQQFVSSKAFADFEKNLPRKEIVISNPTAAPLSFTLSFTNDEDKQKSSVFKIIETIGGLHPLSRDQNLTTLSSFQSPRKLKPVQPIQKLTSTLNKQKTFIGNQKSNPLISTYSSKSLFKLTPGEEMRVYADIKLDELSFIRHEYENNSQSFKSKEEVSGKFKIEFSSGEIQVIPTQITVHFPLISTNIQSLNFGIVGKNPSTRSFRIINYSTVSSAKWKIIEPKQVFKVFFIEKRNKSQSLINNNQGSNIQNENGQGNISNLNGFIGPHDSEEVYVTFRPRASKQYDMNILIQAEGGKNIIFSINGIGNIDELELSDEHAEGQIELSKNNFISSRNDNDLIIPSRVD